jgi:hypothetical protein
MTAAGLACGSCRTELSANGRAEAGATVARYGPEEEKRANLSARVKARRRPSRHVTL